MLLGVLCVVQCRSCACWIRAGLWPSDMPSTCGNCQPVDDHPDLRGHQPDPAHGHGPPAPEVALWFAFPLPGTEMSSGPLPAVSGQARTWRAARAFGPFGGGGDVLEHAAEDDDAVERRNEQPSTHDLRARAAGRSPAGCRSSSRHSPCPPTAPARPGPAASSPRAAAAVSRLDHLDPPEIQGVAHEQMPGVAAAAAQPDPAGQPVEQPADGPGEPGRNTTRSRRRCPRSLATAPRARHRTDAVARVDVQRSASPRRDRSAADRWARRASRPTTTGWRPCASRVDRNARLMA